MVLRQAGKDVHLLAGVRYGSGWGGVRAATLPGQYYYIQPGRGGVPAVTLLPQWPPNTNTYCMLTHPLPDPLCPLYFFSSKVKLELMQEDYSVPQDTQY